MKPKKEPELSCICGDSKPEVEHGFEMNNDGCVDAKYYVVCKSCGIRTIGGKKPAVIKLWNEWR